MEKNKFNQIVVWQGTVLGDATKEQFIDFIKETFDCRAMFIDEIVTLPNIVNGMPEEDTGGRHDILFYIHVDDVRKFAVPRFAYGMRWWEDVLDNMADNVDVPIYPISVLKKYPYGWDSSDSAFMEKFGNLITQEEEY